MPFDMVGYAELTPGTGLVGVTAALNDTLYEFVNDRIRIRKGRPALIGAFCAACSTGEDWRLSQPDLKVDRQFIKIQTMLDNDPTQGYEHYFGRPLPLRDGKLLYTHIRNATDEAVLIGLMLSNGSIPMSLLDSVKPTHTILGEGDQAVTGLAWTPVAITWDLQLEEGIYGVVGMRLGHYGAVPAAAIGRLIIPGNTDNRPGVPSALMEAAHKEFQSVTRLPFCDWPFMPEIHFSTETGYPNLEILSTYAVTDFDVQLQLKKIRELA